MRSDTTLELISSITSATTEAELLQKMQAVARAIGYDQVLFGIEMRIPGGAPLQHSTSGYPMEYQELYQHRAFLTRDPTVAHCQKNAKPLVWCQRMYTQDTYEIMEESSRFGLGHGLSLPVHEAGLVLSMLSLARDKPLESDEERRRVIAAGNVLAHCVHVASENIILPGLLASRRPHLSPREQQCFQLVALGKTNWDIGQHLKISSETAAVHVKSVLKKLGVSTRMQAVAIGVALGMIKP